MSTGHFMHAIQFVADYGDQHDFTFPHLARAIGSVRYVTALDEYYALVAQLVVAQTKLREALR